MRYVFADSAHQCHQCQVTVKFEIYEQTEFIEDVTRKTFPANKEYTKRAMKLPHSSNKLAFKTLSSVFTPEKYHAAVSPNTKGNRNGFIFAIDVSKTPQENGQAP